MIKAEVEGSGFLLLAAGCRVFEGAWAALGIADLSEADSTTVSAPLLALFFFVILWNKIWCGKRVISVVEEYSKRGTRCVQGPVSKTRTTLVITVPYLGRVRGNLV